MRRAKPTQLRVNRSKFTLEHGIAGLPLPEMWTHVTAARKLAGDGKTLPNGSAYENLCASSKSDGVEHNARSFQKTIVSVRDKGIKNAIKAYAIGNGVYEIYGGHHRAVAALVTNRDVPISLRPFDELETANVDRVRAAYAKVRMTEKLAPNGSYNPLRGLHALRASRDRLLLMYRRAMTTPGTRVLDAGCNDGYFGVAMLQHAFDVDFVEMSAPYCDVVRAKIKTLTRPTGHARIMNSTITKAPLDSQYDFVFYTDVLYHTVTKIGLRAGIADFVQLLKRTKRGMLFCPGRWDKLRKAGFTETRMASIVRNARCRLRLIGRDSDLGYYRELYWIDQ